MTPPDSHRTYERPQFQRHCPGCFQFKNGQAACPHCGYDESALRSALFLPHGITLGGQYRVGRVLGRPGGFGITYLGWDINLQQRVAIKEYLPREIATRAPSSLEVQVHTGDDKRGFEFGKEQFLREARIVAKLDHPNIVRVRNFFNANATAYLVMDYYEGMSLGEYLSSVRARLEPELAIPLVKPILDGLQYVHERGLVHRDLKPHNIYLAAVGRPIVLDFGAARQAAGDRVQSLSVVLTEGYAPLEQYQRRAVQGPWTDVYGVAATLYRMLVGQAPPIALDRIGKDPMDDGGWNGVPDSLVAAFVKALAVRPSDRYQSALEFREALEAAYPDQHEPLPEGEPAALPAVFPELPVEPRFTRDSRESLVPARIAAGLPRPSIVAARGDDRDSAAETVVPRPSPPIDPTRLPPLRPGDRRLGDEVTTRPVAPRAPVAGRAMPSDEPPTQPREPVVPSSPWRTGPAAEEDDAALVHALPSAAAAVVATESADDSLRRYDEPEATPRRPSFWVGLSLVALAILAVAYVLLNPPGRREPTSSGAVAAAPQPPANQSPPAVVETPDVVAKPAETPTDDLPPKVTGVTGPSLPQALPVLVEVPAGEIRLTETGAGGVAGGSVAARVSRLSAGETEVTVAQFREFVAATGYRNPRWQNYPCESAGGRLPEWDRPGYGQGDEFPVVCTSWADASAYAAWLSKLSGARWRLPTEAEWEYLANAGRPTRFWWGDEFESRMAACQGCPPKVPTHPSAVKTFPQNPFGLHETLGNVREWTCSPYAPYSEGTAVLCATAAARFALRGGSWQQPVASLAARQRDQAEPDHRDVWTGFRVVREP